MKARIFRPSRNAMQSGNAHGEEWRLEFLPQTALFVEPLMGWTGSKDTARQVDLHFASEREAVEYARANGIEFELAAPKMRVFRPKSYAANFAYNRVS